MFNFRIKIIELQNVNDDKYYANDNIFEESSAKGFTKL
jgi:hypothetical protein